MPDTAPNPGPAPLPKRARPGRGPRCVSLVLQGGGALGSYQAGVYEVMAASPHQPEWVAGISIGAINAAIIAGNPPESRVPRLRDFWRGVTSRPPLLPDAAQDIFAPLRRLLSSHQALVLGQPGFFTPRLPVEWLAGGVTSYYSTHALRSTLERLVDFDRIGAKGEMRLSVGAVNVRTGQFAFFDSDHTRIRPEHVMASGALPPSFPAVEIDGEHYWDGGMVTNTPLAYVLDNLPRRPSVCVQVDLFQAYGALPRTLDEIAERDKDIRYSSRTRVSTDLHAEKHQMRHAINDLLERLPEEYRDLPEARRLQRLACVSEIDIVQLIYRPFRPQGSTKDYEFSRETMEERWRQGVEDASLTVAAAPWTAPRPPETGVRIFDVLHDLLKAGRHPSQPAPKARKGSVETRTRAGSKATAEDRPVTEGVSPSQS